MPSQLPSKRTSRIALSFALATLVWGTVALWLNSDGQSIIAILIYIYGGLAFGGLTIAFGIWLIIHGIKARVRITRIFPLPFIAQSCFLVVVFFGVSFSLAFFARLKVSSAALQSAATKVKSGATLQTPQRIGLFRVQEIDRVNDTVRFIVGSVGFDDFGVVYSPSSVPPKLGEDSYTHVFGPWWSWRRSW